MIIFGEASTPVNMFASSADVMETIPPKRNGSVPRQKLKMNMKHNNGTNVTVREAIVTKYPKFQTDILMKWMIDNKHNPCPNPGEIEYLKGKTGLTASQITNWTTNVRKRNVKATCKGGKKPHHFIDFLFLAFDREKKRNAGHTSPRTGSCSKNKMSAKPVFKMLPTSAVTVVSPIEMENAPYIHESEEILPSIENWDGQLLPDNEKEMNEQFAEEEWFGTSFDYFNKTTTQSIDILQIKKVDSWSDVIIDPMDINDVVDTKLMEEFAQRCQQMDSNDDCRDDLESLKLQIEDDDDDSRSLGSCDVIILYDENLSDMIHPKHNQMSNEELHLDTPEVSLVYPIVSPESCSIENDVISLASLSFDMDVSSFEYDEEFPEEIDLPVIEYAVSVS
jgi:Homeobox KN domain